MTDRPRRLPPSQQQRLQVLADRAAPGSNRGGTQWVKPTAVRLPTMQGGSFSAVVVGDTTGFDDATAISSTTGTGPDSIATAVRAVAIGHGPAVLATEGVSIGNGYVGVGSDASIALGYGTQVDDGCTVSTAIGGGQVHASGTGGASIALGWDSQTVAGDAIAAGHFASVTALRGIAVGSSTSVSGVGAVAIGCDSGGTGASTTVDNEFVLGTANHIVIVNGALVISDGSGGLHRIVVSTGGALSTVAYP